MTIGISKRLRVNMNEQVGHLIGVDMKWVLDVEKHKKIILQGLDKKNGKFKLMIIGNSWAANHARIFYDECGKKANSIVQFTIAGEQ